MSQAHWLHRLTRSEGPGPESKQSALIGQLEQCWPLIGCQLMLFSPDQSLAIGVGALGEYQELGPALLRASLL